MENNITTYKSKATEVIHYLPVKHKSRILNTIRQLCLKEGYIDYPTVDAIFHALLLLAYTNQDSEKPVEELLELYDEFEEKGEMGIIINQIPAIEYDSMIGYLQKTLEDIKPELMEKN